MIRGVGGLGYRATVEVIAPVSKRPIWLVDATTATGGCRRSWSFRGSWTSGRQDAALEAPCIDQTVFDPTVAALYWSATSNPFGSLEPYAWTLSFVDGSVSINSKLSNNYVRAVRTAL